MPGLSVALAAEHDLVTLLAPQSRYGVKTLGIRLSHFQELEME